MAVVAQKMAVGQRKVLNGLQELIFRWEISGDWARLAPKVKEDLIGRNNVDEDRAYLRGLCDGGTRRPCPGDRAATQNTHHNDLAVHAIDADPATRVAYRFALVHGTLVRYLQPRCHGAQREVRRPGAERDCACRQRHGRQRHRCERWRRDVF